MALAQLQAALARLVTDAEARAAFARDSETAARALGLDAGDAGSLAALAPRALERFAGSLMAKRVLDARKLLPLTAMALADEFGPALRRTLTGPPVGAAADALGLVAALAREPRPLQPWIGDLARYEGAFVVAREWGFGIRVLCFRYPVALIGMALATGERNCAISPHGGVALWARLPGGVLIHRAWWPRVR
jgi:hypothetical protein